MLSFSFHVLQDKQTTTNSSYHWSFQEKQDQTPSHTKQAQLKKKDNPNKCKSFQALSLGQGSGEMTERLSFLQLIFLYLSPKLHAAPSAAKGN